MKSVIILLTLSIFCVIVQEISSASPRAIAPSRGNYGGTESNKYKQPSKQGEGGYDDDDTKPPFFPGNAMMLFQLKTAITSSLHKIEDDKESLWRIKEQIKLLKGVIWALFSFYKDAVEGLITKCVIIGPNTFPSPIKIGNKCYTISDTTPGSVPDETYSDAKQKCLAHGGVLAAPSLLEGSTFGVDLKEYLQQDLQSGHITSNTMAERYWIDGDGLNQQKIETSYEFEIPNNFIRYVTMNINPFAPAELIGDSGLTLVGPILANEENWYIDVKPEGDSLPYICEFPTVFDLGGFSIDFEDKFFRTVKSSLLQDFLRKVKIIQAKKLAARNSIVDSANHKAEEVKAEEVKTEEIIMKEPQEVKVVAKVENEKKSSQPEIDLGTKTTEVTQKVENEKKSSQPELALGTKTTEVVQKAENANAEELPTATKKDELPETEKIQQKEEIKVAEELPKKENDVIAKEEDAIVVEGDKNVSEKTLLLEDILGKLEKLEGFRALKQKKSN